jgi:hypothetical protein
MSVIKPRTRGKRLVKHRTRLDEENQETLYAYAAFLDESTEYVVNELIDVVLARDKEFVRWRAEHPQSFVSRPSTNTRAPARHSEPTVASAHPMPSLASVSS